MKNTKKTEIIEIPETGVKELNIESLIAKAIDKNIPVDVMERLLVIRRELKAEFAKGEFDKAMAAFQKACPIIEKKDIAGSGNFSYKYATLDHIVRQVKDLLAENGFSYTYDTKKTDNALTTFCKVKHIAGHSETSQFGIAIDTSARMNISQKDGSAASYGKRYAFVNAFGLTVGGEDTDSQLVPSTARETPHTPFYDTAGKTTPNYLLSIQQQRKIFALLNEKNYSKEDLDKSIEWRFKKDSITKLTVDEANRLIGIIEQQKPKPSELDEDEPEVDPTDAGQGILEMQNENTTH